MKHRTLTLLVLSALGGCAQQWRPAPAVAGPCAVTEAVRMHYAGVRFHNVGRRAVERDAQARVSRVLRPGDMATMDFRPDRLTIDLDEGGLIAGLRCG